MERTGLLKYRADRRTLLFVASWLAVVGYGFTADLTWPGRLGLSVVLSVGSFVCAVITHNTVHVPIFHKRSLNRLFQVVLTVCYGHPVSAYVPGHNLSHHQNTQTAKDLMRTTKLRFRWNFLNQFLFAWVVGPKIFASNIAYAKLMYERRPAWFRQFAIESVVYIGASLALLVLDPLDFVFYVLIPHQYAAWGIMGINFAQHDGCDADHPYNHSRNFVSPVINFITFNNGYHGMHHMEPGLHWSLLPAAHERDLAPNVHPALDQQSFIAFCWRQYVFPGVRLRYDGDPVALPAPVADEDWLPGRADPIQDDEIGAMGTA